MRRYGLNDGPWERIKDLLPGRKIMSAGQPRISVCLWKRFYIVTVPAFRGVTCQCGSGTSRRWCESGVIKWIFCHLANEYKMIDSTIVLAHQHSADAHKKGTRIRLSGDPVVD